MTDASCESRATLWRLSTLYAAAFLLLIVLTLPLWLGSGEFPKVPALTRLASVSRSTDRVVLGAFAAVALIGAAITRRWPPFWIAATSFALVSFALNQHRLQVWAYHLCAAGMLTQFSRPGRAIPRLRWLTISIYAWSAVSKLDAGFAAGPGRMLLDGLTTALRINPPAGAFEQYGPWLMPLGELLTAIALAVPPWRSIGLYLSIAMHVLLLLAVGPLGLNHEFGVQLWNALFLVQNLMLFRPRATRPEAPSVVDTRKTVRWSDRFAGALLAVVIAMPAVQPWGFWDVWPSWAVYSTRGGWTTSFVHRDDIENLPEDARAFVGEPPPLSDWHPIDIDAWSLRKLHCPVYPQPRFRLAVAAALSRRARIQVERRTPPDRITGATQIETIEVTGGELPPQVASRFWLNTVPRVNHAR